MAQAGNVSYHVIYTILAVHCTFIWIKKQSTNLSISQYSYTDIQKGPAIQVMCQAVTS